MNDLAASIAPVPVVLLRFSMRYVSMFFLVALVGLAGCDSVSSDQTQSPEAASTAARVVSSTDMIPYLAAGDYGGGVLEVGAVFQPTPGSFSKLTRTHDFIEYTIQTGGLPQGAYTIWLVVINKPTECLTRPCTEVDVFERTETVDASVFWTDGEVVDATGRGWFKARIARGYFPTVAGEIGWPGSGLQNTMGGEFHLVVKYHGLASDDPAVLYDQLHTLVGSCEEGANAYDFGPGFGIQCFDPHLAIHMP